MNCPPCRTELKASRHSSGVQIDYCPDCRGVWLDRGELEKIIERSNSYYNEYEYENSNNFDKYQHDKHNKHEHDKHKHKKKSLLEDLFDF